MNVIVLGMKDDTNDNGHDNNDENDITDDKRGTNENYDHIDNDKTNNQLSNCQALCVNCHSKKIRQDRGYSK